MMNRGRHDMAKYGLRSSRGTEVGMRKVKHPDNKVTALREHGTLNTRPCDVRDRVFERGGFFDARDMVQVKYEMLRRVHAEGVSVAEATRVFGVSRPTFYKAREAYKRRGLPGLLPARRGPKGGHKLTERVITFLEKVLAADSSTNPRSLATMVRRRFRMKIHPRSIEHALARRKRGRR
jgi:transposase